MDPPGRVRRRGGGLPAADGTADQSPLADLSSSAAASPAAAAAAAAPRSLAAALLPLLLLTVAALLAVVSDRALLPPPRPAATTPAAVFSEERARDHLARILSFGIRTVGSAANEVRTPNYILQEADKVRDEAQRLGLPVDVEAEVQHPSGSFTSWFLGGFTNVYDEVTNVLVRVSSSDARSKQNALLVSAHFDTALGTVAASDDAAMCAAMLEVMRNIAHRNEPLPHAVVFIFNGAEETNWQAAHGFITQHRWAASVRSVINLEGTGAGGRAMVVQTGPKHSWIAQAYARFAPRPHASTLAQEIFQAKIVPGWTDFETYIEYADHEIAGIDMVFIQDGYVYHTKQDDLAHVTPGTLQHLGENLLPACEALASSPYLVDALTLRDRTAVFFDVLGQYMIVISDAEMAVRVYWVLLGCVLAVDVAAFPAAAGSSRRWWAASFVGAAARQATVLVGGVFSAAAVGAAFALSGRSMGWYARFDMTSLLYAVVALGGTLAARGWPGQAAAAAAARPSVWGSEAERGVVAFFACWLLGFVLIGAKSAYIPALQVGAALVGCGWSKATSRATQKGDARAGAFGWRDGVHDLVVCFPPTLIHAQVYMALATYFIPLTGRTGDHIPVDLVVAGLLGVCGSITAAGPAAMLLRRSRSLARTVAMACAAIALLLLMVLLLQFPFTPETPKRLYIQQTTRAVFAKGQWDASPVYADRGLWVNPFDIRGLSPDVDALAIPELSGPGRIDATCDTTKVYCGWPWYFPIAEMISGGWFVPLDPSVPLVDLDDQGAASGFRLTVLGDEVLEADAAGHPRRRRLRFRGVGPTHLALIVEGPLSAWSLTEDQVPYDSSASCLQLSSDDVDECRWVFYSTGSGSPRLGRASWEFWLETPSVDSTLRLAFYGHYGLDRQTEGPTLQRIAAQLPEWVTLVSFGSVWHQYEF